MAQMTPDIPQPSQVDILKSYLLDRRRALLAEVAAIEKLLGIERPKKQTVDNR